MGMAPDALEHQADGLEMDRQHHFHSHQRIGEQHPQKGPIAEGAARARKRGVEDWQAGLVLMDGDGDIAAGRADAKLVAAIA